jgi:hypothetical protein
MLADAMPMLSAPSPLWFGTRRVAVSETALTLTQRELDRLIERRLAKERRRLQKQHAKELDTLRADLERERQQRWFPRLRRWLWAVH